LQTTRTTARWGPLAGYDLCSPIAIAHSAPGLRGEDTAGKTVEDPTIRRAPAGPRMAARCGGTLRRRSVQALMLLPISSCRWCLGWIRRTATRRCRSTWWGRRLCHLDCQSLLNGSCGGDACALRRPARMSSTAWQKWSEQLQRASLISSDRVGRCQPRERKAVPRTMARPGSARPPKTKSLTLTWTENSAGLILRICSPAWDHRHLGAIEPVVQLHWFANIAKR
jgi:hypothetical protein